MNSENRKDTLLDKILDQATEQGKKVVDVVYSIDPEDEGHLGEKEYIGPYVYFITE